MKFVERFMLYLPFGVLAIALAQVIGFATLHEPYLAGAWTVTSMMSSLTIIAVQRWQSAEDRSKAERAINKHLTDVITRHIEQSGENNEDGS